MIRQMRTQILLDISRGDYFDRENVKIITQLNYIEQYYWYDVNSNII